MRFTARAATLVAALMLSSPLFAAGLSNPTLEERQVLAKAEEAQVQESPQKRAFIDQQLALSPQDAAKFWPIYEQHQAALNDLNRRSVENILTYARAWNAGSVDDETANRVAREAIAIEEDEAALLKRTYVHASKAVSPAQAARYVQIEAKARSVLRAQAMMSVPLIK
ncbi:hypothetical protein [Lysobacter terrae]